MKLRLRVTVSADTSQADTKEQAQSVKSEEISPPDPSSLLVDAKQFPPQAELLTSVETCIRDLLRNTSEYDSAACKSKLNQSTDLNLKTEAPVPEPFNADTGMI